MLNAVSGFSGSKRNGLFINSCFAHCQTERQDTWFAHNSPRIGNKARPTLHYLVQSYHTSRKHNSESFVVIDTMTKHCVMEFGSAPSYYQLYKFTVPSAPRNKHMQSAVCSGFSILVRSLLICLIINMQGIAQSVGDWYFDRAEVKSIDCPYPCDKTCHNLVFRQSFQENEANQPLLLLPFLGFF